MSQVKQRIEGNVALLTVSNPPHGYMNDEMVRELDGLIRLLDDDPNIKVMVLTGGDPGIFIQHYDLRELESIGQKLRDRGMSFPDDSHMPERRVDLLFRRIESSRKIVISAINGNAMGGGLELALSCDFRLALDGDYLIGLPEVRVGMLPGAGGTQRLTRTIGLPKALDMMLHGRRIHPKQAFEIGLLHELCGSSVLDRAMERALELAEQSLQALASIKRLAYQALELPFYLGLDLERSLFVKLLSSKEGLDRLAAIVHDGRDFRTL